MTSMKMWYLLLLAAFQPIVPTVAEVVESVSDCDQFLLEAKPPHVPGILEGGNNLNQNRYKFICQTYYNEKRFLTFYDTENKIPVYSAIKYTGKAKEKSERPKTHWKIEPQLEELDMDKNMLNEDTNRTYKNQAGNKDYKDQKEFTRGHLIASTYGFQRFDRESTFTLTNIVPQEKTFNEGSWETMEKCIKCVMDRHCTNKTDTEAYVVTGAQPSTTSINVKVNVPSVLWSAFCCYSPKEKKWIANAHGGNNVPEKLSKKKSEKKTMPTKTLGELKQQLGITVFPETLCPETVFFTDSDYCPCPRSTSTTSSRPT